MLGATCRYVRPWSQQVELIERTSNKHLHCTSGQWVSMRKVNSTYWGCISSNDGKVDKQTMMTGKGTELVHIITNTKRKPRQATIKFWPSMAGREAKRNWQRQVGQCSKHPLFQKIAQGMNYGSNVNNKRNAAVEIIHVLIEAAAYQAKKPISWTGF